MLNLNYIIASNILQIMVYIYKLKSFFFYSDFYKFYVYDENFIKVSNFNYLAFFKTKDCAK